MAKKTEETDSEETGKQSYWRNVGIQAPPEDLDKTLNEMGKLKADAFVKQEDDFHRWPEVPSKNPAENTLQGIFLGGEVTARNRVVFAIARKDSSGKPTTTRFLGGATLTRGMRNVKIGAPCKIVFTGTKESDKGNPTKIFEVYTVNS